MAKFPLSLVRLPSFNWESQYEVAKILAFGEGRGGVGVKMPFCIIKN